MSVVTFQIANNPNYLSEIAPCATVEAEFGAVCIEGSLLTMAHHGPRAGQPAPCSYSNGCGEGVKTVGLSHFDLDTLGGCMAILGVKPEVEGFWELAEFVDLNGPHKLGNNDASEENLRRLYAFWAWSDNNKVFPPRDGSVADITEKVMAGVEILKKILADDEALLRQGDEFKTAGEKLNTSSFVEMRDEVIVRVFAGFVNHLYVTPDGVAAKAIVAYNTATGGITVSFADAPTGKGACEIVQVLWGDLAGGHAGIAGAPRGQRMSLKDFSDAVDAVIEAL